ncbi:hypothetical protein BpHYR1_030337, partial [Brachionus plicatilis]
LCDQEINVEVCNIQQMLIGLHGMGTSLLINLERIKIRLKLTFGLKVKELIERRNSRLNIIKCLSIRKWGLKPKTLGDLYKSLIESILDYSFPRLNSFPETNIKKIQVIHNSVVRSILKLKYDTTSNIMHQETFNKLEPLAVSNPLFELSERYVRPGLSQSVPLVIRLMEEYRKGFESNYISNPTQDKYNPKCYSLIIRQIEKK